MSGNSTESEVIRVTRNQLREIDRRATEEFGIPGIVLMENAAIGATVAAMEMLLESRGTSALILCGGGNNGGDGLAIARHLHNRGADVSIALTTDPAKYHGDALTNWRIVSAMRLRSGPADAAEISRTSVALIIDAIFGTGLDRAPREPFGEIVEAVAESGRPVLAVDVPSGLDCDTGVPPGACIAATRTVTFVAEKIGFPRPEARRVLGRVTVAPIGCPRELVERIAGRKPSEPVTAGGGDGA